MPKAKPHSKTTETKKCPCILLAIAVALAAAIAAASWFALRPAAKPPTPTPGGHLYNPYINVPHGRGGIPYLGKPNAKTTVVLYEDFGSPEMRDFVLNQEPAFVHGYVVPGFVRLMVYDVGITSPKAASAAEAAACAADQGYYWDYRNLLFHNQGKVNFNRDGFIALAKIAGLDVDSFTRCYDLNTHHADVQARTKNAQEMAITRFPTWDIGRKLYEGVASLESNDPNHPGLRQLLAPILMEAMQK